MTRELDANQKSEKTVSTTANTLDGTTKNLNTIAVPQTIYSTTSYYFVYKV